MLFRSAEREEDGGGGGHFAIRSFCWSSCISGKAKSAMADEVAVRRREEGRRWEGNKDVVAYASTPQIG